MQFKGIGLGIGHQGVWACMLYKYAKRTHKFLVLFYCYFS